MTDVKAVPQSSIDPDVTFGVAQFLTPVVLDLESLVGNGKQAQRSFGVTRRRADRGVLTIQ